MTFLSTLLFLVAIQDPHVGSGTFEGTVTRAGGRQPVADADVRVWEDYGPDFHTKTDANGDYVMAIPAGIYNLEVQADGYVHVSPWTDAGATLPLTITANQRLRRDIPLHTISTISGRILDDNREPLAGIRVEILRLTQAARGRPEWRWVAFDTTDDKGEYGAKLSAGEYYVRARNEPEAKSAWGSVDMNLTYFPGTPDGRSAAAILLRAGDEKYAEFSLAHAGTYSVTGQIEDLDPPQDDLTQAAELYIVPRDSSIPLDQQDGIPVADNFRISGLLPGAYDLFAVRYFSFKYTSAVRVVKESFEIRDADIEGIKLVLEYGIDIKGRIKVIGGPAAPVDLKARFDAEQFPLKLRRKDDFTGLIDRPIRMMSDESFEFSKVPVGAYDLVVSPDSASADFYIADVREGSRSVFDDGLQVTHRPMESLEILLRSDGGGVEGSILGTKTSPVLVVLAPQPARRKNGSLFRTVSLTDASKPFSLSQLAPGLYSLFAFELESETEKVPFLSEDFLSRHENRGVSVMVERGAVSGPVRVPLIPIAR